MDFLRCCAPQVLFSGAAGAGKSVALCTKAMIEGAIPGNVVLLCRKWYASLRVSTLRTLLDGEGTTAPILPPGTYVHNKSEKRIDIRGGGTIYYLGLGDDVERMRSISAGCVLIDECTELSQLEWNELHLRCRITAGSQQILGACNPGPQSHWLYREFIRPHTNAQRVAFQVDSGQNPFLSHKTIEALDGLAGDMRARMRDGQWLASESLIYGDLVDRAVVPGSQVPDPAGHAVRYIGYDYGFSNPAALLLCTVHDGVLWVHDELEQSRLGLDATLKWCHGHRALDPTIMIDPSAAGMAEEIRSKGWSVIPADNTVLLGIDRVRDAMQSGRLKISSRCHQLIEELRGYTWGPDHKPVKEADHTCDALRYVAMAAIASTAQAILEERDDPPANWTIV